MWFFFSVGNQFQKLYLHISSLLFVHVQWKFSYIENYFRLSNTRQSWGKDHLCANAWRQGWGTAGWLRSWRKSVEGRVYKQEPLCATGLIPQKTSGRWHRAHLKDVLPNRQGSVVIYFPTLPLTQGHCLPWTSKETLRISNLIEFSAVGKDSKGASWEDKGKALAASTMVNSVNTL